MNAKVIKDGDRVIITFTGIEDPEYFLQKVVELASTCTEEEIITQEVLGLTPPAEMEFVESYDTTKIETEEVIENDEHEETPNDDVISESLDDFDEPYAGKTPREILASPQFEGFYYLCNANIPQRYKEECDLLLYEFAKRKNFFPPPYGDTERMIRYLKVAEKILGNDWPGLADINKVIENSPIPNEFVKGLDELDVLCEFASEHISNFFNAKKQ